MRTLTRVSWYKVSAIGRIWFNAKMLHLQGVNNNNRMKDWCTIMQQMNTMHSYLRTLCNTELNNILKTLLYLLYKTCIHNTVFEYYWSTTYIIEILLLKCPWYYIKHKKAKPTIKSRFIQQKMPILTAKRKLWFFFFLLLSFQENKAWWLDV